MSTLNKVYFRVNSIQNNTLVLGIYDSLEMPSLTLTSETKDGTEATSSVNLPSYQGATNAANGVSGLVPAATSVDRDKFLKGDGTWAEVSTAKEVGYFTNEPTQQSAASLDLESFIFYEDSSAETDLEIAYVSLTGNQEVYGVKSFVNGIEAASADISGTVTADRFNGNVENGTLATANAVVVTNASKKLTASTTITTTELGYLDGVTSSIQTQLDGKAASSHNHDASDITSGTLDAARLPSIDASKITSGTIDIARLPAGALERLVTVADETARFALTSSNVQLGDTVRQSDTGLMYYVVDTSNLNSEAGYAVYTAGAATSVPWSGVTDKPSTYAPSAHDQASNTINAMTGYSKPSSTSAIETSDTLNAAIGKLEKALDGKQASGSYAAASHNHASSEVTAMTGYSKPSSTSAIAAADTLNSAIGKLEKALDAKQASGTYLTPSSTLDATKLSGTIPSECYTDTVYTHPTTAGNKHIPSGGSSGQFLGWSADGTAAWVNSPDTNSTTHIYAGASSNATSNASSATSNTATYIVICDDSTARNAVQISGSNGTTVSAANGVLTIDSPALAAVTTSQIDTLFA